MIKINKIGFLYSLILSFLSTLLLEYFLFVFKYETFDGFQFIYTLIYPHSYKIYISILVFYIFSNLFFLLLNNSLFKNFIFIILIALLFKMNILKEIELGIQIYNRILDLNNGISNKYTKPIYFDCNPTHLIAHAGGEIENYSYTNSLESLNNSYKYGFKLFELDIRKSRDNIYFAMHEFSQWKKMSGYIDNKYPSAEEFKQYKIYSKYTPMTIKEINEWFKKHSDTYLVTDKINDPENFIKFFKFKERLMMELFSMKSILKGIELGIKVMPSANIVHLLGKNGPEIFKKLNIEYIVVPYNYPNISLLKSYMQNGIKVFIYGLYGKNIKNKYYYGRYVNDVESLKICKGE